MCGHCARRKHPRDRLGRAPAEGRARIGYHEQERNGFTNVYLDSVEPLAPESAQDDGSGDVHEADEVARKTAVDTAPWLLGSEPERAVPAKELFAKLRPFKELVADDIRDGDHAA
jgi:hypothetical protein